MLATMPRAVRRRVGTAALVTGVVLAAGGCGGIGQPAPYDSPGINGLVIPTPSPDPADFVDGVDNPWLPLQPGATRTFRVTDDGAEVGSIETTVLDATTDVDGLSATAVTTVTDIDGVTDESTRLYAQDSDGNIWLVGADTGGDGWRAGTDGAEAGLAMPAHPRLGDGWLAYAVPGLPEAAIRVEEQSRDMVRTRDEAGTATLMTYASGAGLVGVEDLGSGWVATLVE